MLVRVHLWLEREEELLRDGKQVVGQIIPPRLDSDGISAPHRSFGPTIYPSLLDLAPSPYKSFRQGRALSCFQLIITTTTTGRIAEVD